MSLEQAHHLLGHSNHCSTTNTAKHFGVGLAQEQWQDISILRRSQSQAEVGTSIQERAKVDDPEQEDVSRSGDCKGTIGCYREGFEAKPAARSQRSNWHEVSSFHKRKDEILEDTSA